MGRYGRKRKNAALRRCVVWGLLAAAAVPGVLSTAVLYDHARQTLGGFVTDTAVFSALYSVPDRTLENLQQRFAGEVYTAPETDATPSPPRQQPETSAEPEAPETEQKTAQEEAQSPSVDPSEIPENQQPPDDYSIPEEYQGPIIEEDMSVSDTTGYLSFGAGVIKNSTSLSDEEAQQYLEAENPVQIDSDGPQVLIMHTHATESFEPYDTDTYDTRHTWRTTDNTQNIVAAGEVMAEAIRSYGIEVLHDETQHDYPSYNGSYERSAVTVQDYLEKYPSIKVVLDVHRDAVQRDTTLVKPVTEIDGRKAAQLMIIAGCDDGTMDMPNWSKNFRFAAGMQDAIESRYPSLTRPVFFCYRKYNQDLTTGSLLIEIGSHGNTLEEVLYTAQLAGDAIGSYLQGLRAAGE